MRRITANRGVEPCPKCGNTVDFNIHSVQVAEDCCEVWAECAKCNHHTPSEFRLEDVWGGTDNDNCYSAMHLWNEYASLNNDAS